MKKLAVLFFFLTCCFSGFAKDPEPKTFLLLFKQKELKSAKISLSQIEAQFSYFFETKSYEGNSELALFIEIPFSNFDECMMGEFLINLGADKIQLQQLAFRVYDLTENKQLITQLIAHSEDDSTPKKKTSKGVKAPSTFVSAPGH